MLRACGRVTRKRFAGRMVRGVQYRRGLLWCGDLVVEVRQGLAGERFAHDLFEGADHVVVFRRDQREGVTGAFGAPGAADAVDVGIGGIGAVVVDQVCDTLYLPPPRGHIRGEPDLVIAALRNLPRSLAPTPRAGSMHAR